MVSANRNELHKLCESYRISAGVESALKRHVEELRLFKKEILPKSQTATQSAKALLQIETLAAKLRKAVVGLTFLDRMALDDEYFGVDDPGFDQAFERTGDHCAFDLAGKLIPGIEDAARNVRERIKDAGKAGAPKVTERQADFIRCIAQTLKRASIAPSLSGPFEEFCCTVFEDAGVTLPERAMKHFMQKIRPSLQAAGYCL